jgi:hypothetical protein
MAGLQEYSTYKVRCSVDSVDDNQRFLGLTQGEHSKIIMFVLNLLSPILFDQSLFLSGFRFQMNVKVYLLMFLQRIQYQVFF